MFIVYVILYSSWKKYDEHKNIPKNDWYLRKFLIIGNYVFFELIQSNVIVLLLQRNVVYLEERSNRWHFWQHISSIFSLWIQFTLIHGECNFTNIKNLNDCTVMSGIKIEKRTKPSGPRLILSLSRWKLFIV